MVEIIGLYRADLAELNEGESEGSKDWRCRHRNNTLLSGLGLDLSACV